MRVRGSGQWLQQIQWSKLLEVPHKQLTIPGKMNASEYMFVQPVRELSIDSNILHDTSEVIQEKNHLNALLVPASLPEGTFAPQSLSVGISAN